MQQLELFLGSALDDHTACGCGGHYLALEGAQRMAF